MISSRVTITQSIPQIPADTQEDNLGLEMTPREGMLLIHEGASSAFLELKQSLPELLLFCNTARIRAILGDVDSSAGDREIGPHE
jgi:hypothetical protein